MEQRRGYLAAAVGAVAGGAILFALGFVLGILYVDRFMPNAELEGIVPPFFGGAGAAAIGIALGTWIALRVRKHERAGVTGIWTGVLALPVGFGALFLSEVVADEVIRGQSSQWAVPLSVALAIAGTAVLVRAFSRS